MKSIHAISTILAGWRIEPSAQTAPSHPSPLPQGRGVRAKGLPEDSEHTPFVRTRSTQRVAIPNLLADALLQGASSTEPRRK